jgi:hypothetical protein
MKTLPLRAESASADSFEALPLLQSVNNQARTSPIFEVNENTAEPLIDDEHQLNFEYLPLYVNRLLRSEAFNALGQKGNELLGASMRLWVNCWLQEKRASLPNDQKSVAELAGYGKDSSRWRDVYADLLTGKWVVCKDNRIYHPFLAECAAESNNIYSLQNLAAASDRRRKSQGASEAGDEGFVFSFYVPKVMGHVQVFRQVHVLMKNGYPVPQGISASNKRKAREKTKDLLIAWRDEHESQGLVNLPNGLWVKKESPPAQPIIRGT